MNIDDIGMPAVLWACPTFVPPRVLIQAALRSKAKGFFLPDAECLRRGL